jgi:hypothetical protein
LRSRYADGVVAPEALCSGTGEKLTPLAGPRLSTRPSIRMPGSASAVMTTRLADPHKGELRFSEIGFHVDHVERHQYRVFAVDIFYTASA